MNSGSAGSDSSKSSALTPSAKAKERIVVPITYSGAISERSSAATITKTSASAIGTILLASRGEAFRRVVDLGRGAADERVRVVAARDLPDLRDRSAAASVNGSSLDVMRTSASGRPC